MFWNKNKNQADNNVSENVTTERKSAEKKV